MRTSIPFVIALFIAIQMATASLAQSLTVLDDFAATTFNAHGMWSPAKQIQGVPPATSVHSIDQTTTPGKLTVDFGSGSGSTVSHAWTESSAWLDEVGDFAQVTVANFFPTGQGNCASPGIHMQSAVDPPVFGGIKRTNSFRYQLEGQGRVRINAYRGADPGSDEYSDPGADIPGYQSGDEVILRVVRSGDRQFLFLYSHEGGDFVHWLTLDHPSGAQDALPIVPALLFNNGTCRFTLTHDDFAVGSIFAPPTLKVVTTDPLNGAGVPSSPAFLVVNFSEDVLAASLDASDLEVDDLPATDVSLIDGNTARFTLGGGFAPGFHTVTIDENSIESDGGLLLESYLGTFQVLSAPTVLEQSVTDVGPRSATVRGEVLEQPTVRVHYGFTDGGTDPGAWDFVQDLGVLSDGPFSALLTGLSSESPYFFRLQALNAVGEVWAAATGSFTTNATPEIGGMAVRGDSTLVFNEIMYHPDGDNNRLEWIEFHNELARDLDVSGWSIDTGVQYVFREGTIVPGGGYLVVAADPDLMEAVTGFASALGPWVGRLANGGEEVILRDNNGRSMSFVDYDDVAPWPAAADGSGASLARRELHTASQRPESWGASSTPGGTPGQTNLILTPTLGINEVAASTDASFFVEVANVSGTTLNLGGHVLADRLGNEYVFPSESVSNGTLRAVMGGDLGFTPVAEEPIFFYSPDRRRVLDGVEVRDVLRGRSPDRGDRWAFPDAPTPGSPNVVSFHDEIVINEIMYHHRPIQGEPVVDSPEEWVEIANRSGAVVDVSGWRLGEAIDFTFPGETMLDAGEFLVVSNNAVELAARTPGADILGNFSGTLSNRDEFVQLFDANGNLADEVHYYDSGRWPRLADGRGASLELRDPDADNARAEAWGASDEALRSSWRTYTFRQVAGTALPHVPESTRFEIGVLDGPGEFLIDDVRILERPDTNPVEFIGNGDFEDVGGGSSDGWLFHGNHRRSAVVEDPDEPGNFVLHVRASGAMKWDIRDSATDGNRVYTTFTNGEQVVDGHQYEVSFRARWLAGGRLLNTRMSVVRVARTTLLDVPDASGTPGAENSLAISNWGPTYDDLTHVPAVPASGEPVVVSVEAADPDGVGSLTLWYRSGIPWESVAMTLENDGRYKAAIPGAGPSTVVQFYVEGEDGLGAITTMPAAGPGSRALYRVEDGQTDSAGPRHVIRVVMRDEDRDFLHLSSNLVSNERLPCTVIFDETESFYDVGIRLKGFASRFNAGVGFSLRFGRDRPYLGMHRRVDIDRNGKKESLIKHIAHRAGGIPAMVDDLGWFVAPRRSETGTAQFRMAGFESDYLASQFRGGSDGTLYEYEVLTFADDTRNDYQDYGDDREDYRWTHLVKNNRERDDFSDLIAMAKVFSLNGPLLAAALGDVIDVDQWMRVFAYQSLVSVSDAYTRSGFHNFMTYSRPEDGRVLAFPWDWDACFARGPQAWVSGQANNNTHKIINRPRNLRSFYGQMKEIMETTYNVAYMTHWADHFGELLGENYDAELQYISDRSAFLQNVIDGAAPFAAFAITTNGGQDFTVNENTVELNGTGWCDVREIRLQGLANPLQIRWTDQTNWTTTVPLELGANLLVLEARDFQAQVVGADSITVTSTVSGLGLVEALRITEIHYHPSLEPGSSFPTESFEFVELLNIGTTPLALAGVRLRGAVEFTFPDLTLEPSDLVVVVRNVAAFNERYGDRNTRIAGRYGGQLDNGGELVRLEDPFGRTVLSFVYSDLWQPSTDGLGSSLTIVDPMAPPASWNDPTSWFASSVFGGTPGELDTDFGELQLPGNANQDEIVDIVDAVAVLFLLFDGPVIALPCDGATVTDGANLALLDHNGDRTVDLSDIVAELEHLFLDGDAHVLGTGCVRIGGCPPGCPD